MCTMPSESSRMPPQVMIHTLTHLFCPIPILTKKSRKALQLTHHYFPLPLSHLTTPHKHIAFSKQELRHPRRALTLLPVRVNHSSSFPAKFLSIRALKGSSQGHCCPKAGIKLQPKPRPETNSYFPALHEQEQPNQPLLQETSGIQPTGTWENRLKPN